MNDSDSERPGKRAWWMLPAPKGIADDAEWEWYCWRTRSLRYPKAQAETKPVTGRTAGWRTGYY